MKSLAFFRKLILSLFLTQLHAAGPMTHLYFAERFCEMTGMPEERVPEFIIGNLFPDIRYMAHIPREATHLPVESLQDILSETDPFLAGMKFHAWIDQVREEFVVASGIYATVTPFAPKHKATFLKFIEEEILADFYDGRKWNACFNEIWAGEQRLAASDEVIHKWHSITQYTMHYRPSWLLWGCSHFRSSFMGISNDILYDWSYQLPKLAQEAQFKAHMQKLVSKILIQIGKGAS